MATDAVTIDQVLAGALAPFGGEETAGALAKQLERMAGQLATFSMVAGPVSGQGSESALEEAARGSAIAPVLSGIGSGLGLAPLILGIARLFGGGESKELPPLMEFALPSPVRVNAGVSDHAEGGPFLIDYAQGESPRVRRTQAEPAPITVQVHAMDSRSFLDHSADIAQAVRQAMLESSVLNDVIREA